jgi:hypothetical protein
VTRQNTAELLHRLQTAIKFMELLTEQVMNLSAFLGASGCQHPLDFIERKTQLLRLLNELNSIN